MPRRQANPAVAKFFLRIGQIKRVTERYDMHTLPLFPLWLILDADGTLASQCRHIVEKTSAR